MFVEKVYSTRFSALPKLVISEASNFPELARFYLDEVVGRGRRLLTALLRRGIESGEFREVDVEHTVYCMIAPLLFSALWKHSLGPFDAKPLDAAALVRCHIDLLLRGLAPDGPARRRRTGRTDATPMGTRKSRGASGLERSMSITRPINRAMRRVANRAWHRFAPAHAAPRDATGRRSDADARPPHDVESCPACSCCC